MQAIILDRTGGPDALRLGEMPDPVATGANVVVRLATAGINHVDLWARRGSPAYPLQPPHILGADGAGVVHAVGPDVEGVQPGDRVAVIPGLSCWQCEWCKRGQDNLCATYEILGTKRNGTYAQFVSVPDLNVVAIPETLSFESAAAFPLAYLTAWHMLHGRAALRAGEAVLVVGGSSGVGIASIQIAKAAGARVFASTTVSSKAGGIRSAGAEAVFVQKGDSDLTKWTMEQSGGKGADVVIETVGPATWEKSVASLAKGGRLANCGETSGPVVNLPLRSLFSKDASVLGARMGTQKEFRDLCAAVFSGKIQPVIDTVFALADAAEAHLHLENRKQVGKVVLKIE